MKARLLTAVIGIPIVLACLANTSPWPLAFLLSLAGFFALRELWQILDHRQPTIMIFVTAACVLIPLMIATTATKRDALDLPAFTAPWLIGIAALTWINAPHLKLLKAALGIGYIVGPLIAILAIHTIEWPQPVLWNIKTPTLMAIIPVWAGDTAAIFAGRAFGKTPFVPSISPNKTLEGAAAYIIASVFTGWAMGWSLGHDHSIGLICGTLCGTLGQVGDLFESWLKRKAGKKDSGDLLPGHGGILDRIDSLLMVTVAVYAVLILAK